MADLASEIRVDDGGGRHYTITGPHGIAELVRWPHLTGAPAEMRAHAAWPARRGEEPGGHCEYAAALGGPCYQRVDPKRAVKLLKSWEAAGRDEHVILAGVADWYAAVLGGRS